MRRLHACPWIRLLSAGIFAAASEIAGRTTRQLVKRPSMANAQAGTSIDNASCPVDHTNMLSPSTACCYQKLVTNPSCCFDQKFKKEVTWQRIQRPGTGWTCNRETKCIDSQEGNRGEDLMVVPHGANCSSPRILYIHGGSWLYSSPTSSGYPQFASRLAVATGAVIFMIDYPLIPYGNFSVILNASIQGLKWLSQHGPEKSCPLDGRVPLFVAGDSSGGGTALSVVMKLQAEPHVLLGQHLAGAFMFSPWTNLMCNTPEYYTNAFAKIQSPHTFKDLTPLQEYVGDIIFQAVTSENADAFSGNALQYVGHDATLQTDPIASPYFALPHHFSGRHMPPLHIAVGGSESILGDSVRVAQAAAKGGADITVEIYNGMWHVFPMYSEGCGSGTDLWAGKHAINSVGIFVRETAWKGAWGTRGRGEIHPRILHFYDPKVDEFSRVGELMPDTSALEWGNEQYQAALQSISETPWWVVLPSIGGSAIAIFVVGLLVGAVLDFGGREAYKRARRVAEYRRKCVEVPVGYVNLDAVIGQKESHQAKKHCKSRLSRSFLMDFLKGVPHDVHNAWRAETIKAKRTSDDSEAMNAVRVENAAWRRMALPSYQPPVLVDEPKSPEPRESLESGSPAKDVIEKTKKSDVTEVWLVATLSGKEGTIEGARRENMAWRQQHLQRQRSINSNETVYLGG